MVAPVRGEHVVVGPQRGARADRDCIGPGAGTRSRAPGQMLVALAAMFARSRTGQVWAEPADDRGDDGIMGASVLHRLGRGDVEGGPAQSLSIRADDEAAAMNPRLAAAAPGRIRRRYRAW